MRKGHQVGCGIFLVRLLGLLGLVLAAAVVYERWPAAGRGRRIEAVIQARLQAAFEQDRQRFFDSLHPVGSATGVVVRNVTVTGWRQGVPTGRVGDIRQLTVHVTLHWKSPLRPDGCTTVRLVFDTTAGRCLEAQILATNGVSGTEAGELAGYVAGALILGALTR